MPDPVSLVKTTTGLAGPAFRICKTGWDNRQARRDLEDILTAALAWAISPEHAGREDVQKAADRLAEIFVSVPPPGASPGRLGRVAIRLRARIHFLPPLRANQEPINETGWDEEQRCWAENALNSPEAEKELNGLPEVVGRVGIDQVITRFPEAFDYATKQAKPSNIRKIILQEHASSESIRALLKMTPRPPVVAGTSVLVGGVSAAGAYLAGLSAGVVIVLGSTIAILAAFAVVAAARFPMRHEAALVVRLAAIHWVVELFDAIGPSDLRGTTPDTIESALRIVISREAPPTSAGTEATDWGELQDVLRELVGDLSDRMIRRAETAGDGPLVAALYAVEDHGKRAQRRPDPAALAALYSALLDVVVVCLPPLPQSALSRTGREIATLSALMSQALLARRAESQSAGEAPVKRPESKRTPTTLPGNAIATSLTARSGATVASTQAGQFEVLLIPGHAADGRWHEFSARLGRWTRSPVWPGAPLKPPAELKDPNWLRDQAFPGSTLNELRRTDRISGDSSCCVAEGRDHHTGSSRLLRAELHRDGSGVVTVDDLPRQNIINDVERLTSELVAAVQILILHASHWAVNDCDHLTARRVKAPSGNGSPPPDATDPSVQVNIKAASKSVTSQLEASRALLVKLLAAREADDLRLIAPGGTPVAPKWSEARRSAIETWARSHHIAYDA